MEKDSDGGPSRGALESMARTPWEDNETGIVALYRTEIFCGFRASGDGHHSISSS